MQIGGDGFKEYLSNVPDEGKLGANERILHAWTAYIFCKENSPCYRAGGAKWVRDATSFARKGITGNKWCNQPVSQAASMGIGAAISNTNAGYQHRVGPCGTVLSMLFRGAHIAPHCVQGIGEFRTEWGSKGTGFMGVHIKEGDFKLMKTDGKGVTVVTREYIK